jgi:hypothetical protein
MTANQLVRYRDRPLGTADDRNDWVRTPKMGLAYPYPVDGRLNQNIEKVPQPAPGWGYRQTCPIDEPTHPQPAYFGHKS